MNILGLIPARGGSKGVPRKNLAPLAGRPLIAHSIEAALASGRLGRVVVSTEDAEIAETARRFGAEVPFLRPAELAADDTGALPVMRQAIAALDGQGWRTDALVYLQPTSPLRRAEHIDAAVEMLLAQAADTVVSVVAVPHQFNPVSLMRLEHGLLQPYLAQEAQPLRRQDKPELWARNGPAVLAAIRATLMDLGLIYGPRTLPLVMTPEDSLDIDTPFDLALVEWVLAHRQS
jgi:CMP-N-acetylneuraminic acid synthetase